MLPEVGASELLVIAIVALIVVGPKDLPVLLRRFGQFMAKLRGMAAEFRASFDEMARQSELDDLRKEVEAMRRGQFADIAAQAGDVEARGMMADIERGLDTAQFHPPMSHQYELPPYEPQPPLSMAEAPAKPPRKPRARKASTPSAAKPRSKKTTTGAKA